MTQKIKSSKYLSIIIPVYNDVDSLRAFLPSVIDFCYELGYSSEVIIIDDGSQDEIASLMQAFIKACQQAQSDQEDWNVDLQLIKLSRNFGKESALSAGLSHANGELVTMMDCDGKHPLDVLGKMIKMMRAQSHIDMIAAIRTTQQHTNFIENIKSRLYGVLLDSARYDIKPNSDNFRLMNGKVVQALNSLPERQRFMKGLYSWVGFHTVYLPYNRKQPNSDIIKRKFKDKFKSNQTSSVTSFSRKPLHWITRFGFIFLISAIFYTLYVIIDTLFLASTDSVSSLIVLSILWLAGIQFFSLGILGEYIGRLYDEVKERPIYLIDKHLSSDTSSEEELQIPIFTNVKKPKYRDESKPNTHHLEGQQVISKRQASADKLNINKPQQGVDTDYLAEVATENQAVGAENPTKKLTKSISQLRSEATPLPTVFNVVESDTVSGFGEFVEQEQISLNQLEELIAEESIQLAFPELDDENV